MPQEIRRTKTSGLYGAFAVAACFLAVFLLSVCSSASAWLFLGGAALMVCCGLFIDRNDRVTYDENGITLYSIWGKPVLYRWTQIRNVDTAVEQLLSKQFLVGLVLRISITESTGRDTVYRFPFKYYSGIPNFLAFVNCRSIE